MSDLISRSYVIDLLYKTFDEYRIATDKTSTLGGFGSEVFKRVREMPTVYDIDKVVAELNELDVKSITRYKNGNFGNFDGVEYYIKKRKAIEIVKRGSVSDDVCEWTKSKDYPFDWFVGCDGCEVNHKQGNYCPRCGKKIKVV